MGTGEVFVRRKIVKTLLCDTILKTFFSLFL